MKKLKNKIQNWLLKSLFNAVTLKDVITYNDKTKQVFINGEKITDGELKNITEEVKFIEKTRIWALLQGTISESAKTQMFNKSTCVEDLIFGKATLYVQDIYNKIFKIINK